MCDFEKRCIFYWQMLDKYLIKASVPVCEVLVYAPNLRPQTVGAKATPPYGLLGGMPTPETSVDVLLSTSVTESPSPIQHALSVLQWFVGKCAS